MGYVIGLLITVGCIVVTTIVLGLFGVETILGVSVAVPLGVALSSVVIYIWNYNVRKNRNAALTIPPESENSPEENYRYGVENGAIGNHSEAITYYTRAIELGLIHPDVYLNRGINCYAGGHIENAMSDFDTAIKLDSTHVQAYYYRALAYFDSAQYDEGLADITHAISLSPNDAALYEYRGNIYDKLGFGSEAEADYARADDAVEVVAAYYHENGRYDEAIAELTYGIKLNPDKVSLYEKRGRIYEECGDIPKAHDDYDRVEQLS